MPEASPSDVRNVMDPGLSDSRISGFIEDAEYDARQEIGDYDDLDAKQKKQLEKYLAALYIIGGPDRRASDFSGDSVSIEYDGSPLRWLKSQVRKRDPSNSLASEAYQTDRHTSTTGD